MRAELGRFLGRQDGATAIDYAFVAALVSIGTVAALSAMSGSLSGLFSGISSSLSGAANG